MIVLTVDLKEFVRPSDKLRDVQYGADGKGYSRKRQLVDSPLHRAVESKVRDDVTVGVSWELRRVTIYPPGRWEPHHAVFAVDNDHPVWESQRKWRAGEPWEYEGEVSFEICEGYLAKPGIDGKPPVLRG